VTGTPARGRVIEWRGLRSVQVGKDAVHESGQFGASGSAEQGEEHRQVWSPWAGVSFRWITMDVWTPPHPCRRCPTLAKRVRHATP
jgi:hypothetical protein